MGVLKICHNFNEHIFKTQLLWLTGILLLQHELKGLGGGVVKERIYILFIKKKDIYIYISRRQGMLPFQFQ